MRIAPEDIENHDDYIGERYGVVTEGSREALRLLAGTEGIILDPVYSARLWPDWSTTSVRAGIDKGQTMVFLHTGGTPALLRTRRTWACRRRRMHSAGEGSPASALRCAHAEIHCHCPA